MRIYVETNFVVEMTLLQAESHACERILELCKGGNAEIMIPAFSIVEPYWKIFGNKSKRINFRDELRKDRTQLSRTTGYESEIKQIEEIDAILNRVIDEEQKRYVAVRERILDVATVIPLDGSVLERCSEFQMLFKQYTDTVVCASIISHHENSVSDKACFLSKDKEAFLDPLVEQLFNDRHCSIFSGFGEGLGFILKSVA